MQRMRTENEFRPRRAKLLLVAGCIAILLLAVCPGELWACPNCKNAFRAGVERAYAASILFLLGMPFALLGGWGVAIYRLLRRRS
jgi:hypothetical protein